MKADGLKQLYPTTATRVTSVDSARSAIIAHDNGQFAGSSVLCAAAKCDDRVFSGLITRVVGGISLPRADKGEKPEWWDRIVTFSLMFSVDAWLVLMGFCICFVEWDTSDPSQWVPKKVSVVHPQFIRHDIYSDQYVVNHQGGQIVVDRNSPNWLVFEPYGELSWTWGAIRVVSLPAAGRTWSKADFGRRCEVTGVGIRKVKLPENADVGTAKEFVNTVANLGNETTVGCPAGYDIDIIAVDANASSLFKDKIADDSEAITMAILGQQGTTTSSASYASANVLKYVQKDRIVFDVNALSSGFHALYAMWAALNGVNTDYAMGWITSLPEDNQKIVAVLQTIAQSLDVIYRHGGDTESILTANNLKIRPDFDGLVAPATGQQPISYNGEPA